MVSHGSLAAESHQECDTEQDPVVLAPHVLSLPFV